MPREARADLKAGLCPSPPFRSSRPPGACLLTREEDYAFAQPTLRKKKLRRLELTAGAERGKVKPGIWSTNKALAKAERELARQAEVAYRRTAAAFTEATQ
jgi:hypothetical protein